MNAWMCVSSFINGKVDKKWPTTHTMSPTNKAIEIYERESEGMATSDYCGTSGVMYAISQRHLNRGI